MTNNFIYSLFEALNKEDIHYAVLRNYQSLPESTGGSDLDLWVRKDDQSKFIKILKNTVGTHKGVLVTKTDSKICPRFCFLGINWGIQIDVHYGVAHHKGYTYMNSSIIENNIMTHNGVKVLSSNIDSIISFLKEILNNRKCKKEYCINAANSLEKLTENEIDFILNSFPSIARKRIVDLFKTKKFDKQSIYALGKYCSQKLVPLSGRIKYTIGQFYKLTRFLKPAGYVIAVLGTDGSGKSTIINEITPILNEAFHNGIRYEHLRPNAIQELGVLLGKKKKSEQPAVVTDPHALKPSGIIGSLFRWGYYMTDYTLGYLKKIYPDKSVKTHLWIFDRYYYDYYIDQRRSRTSLPQWVLRLGELFVPTPDLILCLGGDPQKIYERKPETSLEEVTRQVSVLKSFCQKRKKAIWIDTCTTKEESVRQAMEAICGMMNKRFSNQEIK